MTANAQANYGNKGGAPFHFGETYAGNVLTGSQTQNALGLAKNLTEAAHADLFKGQRLNVLAGAGEHGARTKLLTTQNTNATNAGNLVPAMRENGDMLTDYKGDPIMVPEAEVGKSMMRGEQSRATAATKGEEARATNAAKPGKAAGKVRSLTTNDANLLNQAVDSLSAQLGAEELDDATRKAIASKAGDYWQNGAASYGEAAKQAIDEVAGQGFEKKGMYGFRKSAPIGGLKKTVPAVQTSPGTAAVASNLAGGLPPEARSRLKEGIVTTFKNGQTWTLQGGQPVQVQ